MYVHGSMEAYHTFIEYLNIDEFLCNLNTILF